MNIRQIARDFARKHVFECELMEEGEPVLIGNDGQEPLHTDDHPFCGDKMCPCHADFEAVLLLTTQRYSGLLTEDETLRLYLGENI